MFTVWESGNETNSFLVAVVRERNFVTIIKGEELKMSEPFSYIC